jgi:hypothetical protein
MTNLLAEAGASGGIDLGAGAVILAGTAALLFAIRFLGRWAAKTHPEPEPVARGAAPGATPPGEPRAAEGLTPEIVAVIAAAVNTAVGAKARIVAISAERPPNVESLMLQWSWEGRRQIYSSHRVR